MYLTPLNVHLHMVKMINLTYIFTKFKILIEINILIGKPIKTEEKLVVAWGWGDGKLDSVC